MIRQIEIVIGPFKDFENTQGKNGLKITSTGSSDDMRIAFTAEKNLAGLSSSSVTLTNLSADTRDLLQTRELRIALYGGYVNHPLTLISSGGITAVTSARQNTEINTALYFIDGLGATNRAHINRTFAASIPVKDVVIELAKTLPKITLGTLDIQGTLGSKGRVLSGSTVEQLNTLGENFGFDWNIQNGTLSALDHKRNNSQLFVLNQDNLLSAIPKLAGPNGTKQLLQGISINTPLDARMQAGDKIRVQSTINPELNRDYRIQSAQLSGSSHSGNWNTQLECLIPR